MIKLRNRYLVSALNNEFYFDELELTIINKDIAKSIGPVVNLKMMFDKETGKSKGFAFVEYQGE